MAFSDNTTYRVTGAVNVTSVGKAMAVQLDNSTPVNRGSPYFYFNHDNQTILCAIPMKSSENSNLYTNIMLINFDKELNVREAKKILFDNRSVQSKILPTEGYKWFYVIKNNDSLWFYVNFGGNYIGGMSCFFNADYPLNNTCFKLTNSGQAFRKIIAYNNKLWAFGGGRLFVFDIDNLTRMKLEKAYKLYELRSDGSKYYYDRNNKNPLVVEDNGYFYIIRYTTKYSNYNGFKTKIIVFKVNEDLNIVWEKYYEFPWSSSSLGVGKAVISGNYLYLFGGFSSGGDYVAIAIDKTSGSLLFVKKFERGSYYQGMRDILFDGGELYSVMSSVFPGFRDAISSFSSDLSEANWLVSGEFCGSNGYSCATYLTTIFSVDNSSLLALGTKADWSNSQDKKQWIVGIQLSKVGGLQSCDYFSEETPQNPDDITGSITVGDYDQPLNFEEIDNSSIDEEVVPLRFESLDLSHFYKESLCGE